MTDETIKKLLSGSIQGVFDSLITKYEEAYPDAQVELTAAGYNHQVLRINDVEVLRFKISLPTSEQPPQADEFFKLEVCVSKWTEARQYPLDFGDSDVN